MSFADELTAAARPKEIATNPFIVAVCSGTASRASIRSFAVHIVGAAESFIRSLYGILAICDEPRVRESLLGNVLEEEGVTGFAPVAGVAIDPARRHPQIGRKFVRATGGSDEDIVAANIRPPRWFKQALADGNWLGAYSYIAVGVEANAPQTYSMLLDPLAKHYGFDEDALSFLAEHVVADVRHGDDGTKMIEDVANTEDRRRRAIEGAHRGGAAWWHLLRRHAPTSA